MACATGAGMRITPNFIMLFLALVCFVLAAVNIPAPRINLVAMGLALWVLSLLII